MPDSPEDEAKRISNERTALLREESRQIAEAIELERAQFDRVVRVAGGAMTVVGIGLAVLAPLSTRGATVSGMALVCGPLAMLLGGQGATRAENVPPWLKWTYVAGAILGSLLGGSALR
jgi:hypothetical protein